MVRVRSPRGWAPLSVPDQRASREAGYNLVMLVVAITLLHIALAVALPVWTTTVRREREQEAIFRGLQYAEAIRVFQQRFGRYPTTLDELLEMEPRSIRQLWTDPLSKGAELPFGLLVPAGSAGQIGTTGGRRGQGADRGSFQRGLQGTTGLLPVGGDPRTFETVKAPAAGQGQQALQKVPPTQEPQRSGGRRRGRQTLAPIRGVYLATEGDSIRVFGGAGRYEDWSFTDTMLPVPSIPDPEGVLPSANADQVGRPFDVALPAPKKAPESDEEVTPRRRRRRRGRGAEGEQR